MEAKTERPLETMEFQMASGIKIKDLRVGTGVEVVQGQNVSIRWTGTLNKGDSFGEGEVIFRAGDRTVIAGLSRGIIGMRVGGIRQLRVGPHLAYRERGAAGIPANSVLVFQVELLSVLDITSNH
jgi:FKBP-type peptidyl-prolyl cis-trans isomerase